MSPLEMEIFGLIVSGDAGIETAADLPGGLSVLAEQDTQQSPQAPVLPAQFIGRRIQSGRYQKGGPCVTGFDCTTFPLVHTPKRSPECSLLRKKNQRSTVAPGVLYRSKTEPFSRFRTPRGQTAEQMPQPTQDARIIF